MQFRVIPGKTRSLRKTMMFSGSAVVFGFSSGIRGLSIVLNHKGKKSRYSIPDTEVGFAINDLHGTYQVWFEYTLTDKKHKIELLND
jgi:hypothetical protein